MSTVPVLDGNGDLTDIERPLPPGRAPASAAKPVVLSIEDQALFEAILAAQASAVITDIDTVLTTSATTPIIPADFSGSYAITIAVSAILGTTPKLDVVVYESDDLGGNWYPVFAFQRITAVGIYKSPAMPYRGNMIKYVETTSGTTPSFTRKVIRASRPAIVPPRFQFIDRDAFLTTTGQSSATFFCAGCSNFDLILVVGTYVTAAEVHLQISHDGLNWESQGQIMVGATGVYRISLSGVAASFVRSRVASGGAGTIQDHTVIRAY